MEYRQVKVRGQFQHDKELYMGPRSFIKNNDGATKGSVFSSQNTGSGFLVITPFKLEDREYVFAALCRNSHENRNILFAFSEKPF